MFSVSRMSLVCILLCGFHLQVCAEDWQGKATQDTSFGSPDADCEGCSDGNSPQGGSCEPDSTSGGFKSSSTHQQYTTFSHTCELPNPIMRVTYDGWSFGVKSNNTASDHTELTQTADVDVKYEVRVKLINADNDKKYNFTLKTRTTSTDIAAQVVALNQDTAASITVDFEAKLDFQSPTHISSGGADYSHTASGTATSTGSIPVNNQAVPSASTYSPTVFHNVGGECYGGSAEVHVADYIFRLDGSASLCQQASCEPSSCGTNVDLAKYSQGENVLYFYVCRLSTCNP